jgi:hypothetical protein
MGSTEFAPSPRMLGKLKENRPRLREACQMLDEWSGYR